MHVNPQTALPSVNSEGTTATIRLRRAGRGPAGPRVFRLRRIVRASLCFVALVSDAGE